LTTSVKDGGIFVLKHAARDDAVWYTLFVANVLKSNDTFFTFSYGGGLRANRLWDPMGVFGDFRGRTIPNFFTSSFNWPELSAGLTFSWGER
jgi:hypothetical protein